MKKLFIEIFLFLIALVNVSFSQTGWELQNSGTLSNLYSVFFIDAATGYAVGDSAILKTTNGGLNWSKQYTQNPLHSVFFINSITGYTCGGHSVYKTTNGGANWNISYFNNSFINASSIYFINSSTGVAAGSWFIVKQGAGAVVRTTDGGTTWNYTTLFFPQVLYSIDFADSFVGFAGGTSPAYKTTNSGQTWFQSGPSSDLYSIFFIDNMTGWTAGGTIVNKTTNGGNNWLSFILNSSLYSVHFVDSQTGWVCGSGGTIYQSTNSGVNWTVQSSGTTTYLYSLSFYNAQTGWAVGADGRILKTTTGGITFIQSISNEIPNTFSLSQNYPNPFNPVTKIKFSLPSNVKREALKVKLIVYDVFGREVQTLVNKNLSPGIYEADFDGSNLPSGVYFYRLQAGEFSQTKKMVLIK